MRGPNETGFAYLRRTTVQSRASAPFDCRHKSVRPSFCERSSQMLAAGIFLTVLCPIGRLVARVQVPNDQKRPGAGVARGIPAHFKISGLGPNPALVPGVGSGKIASKHPHDLNWTCKSALDASLPGVLLFALKASFVEQIHRSAACHHCSLCHSFASPQDIPSDLAHRVFSGPGALPFRQHDDVRVLRFNEGDDFLPSRFAKPPPAVS